jgi:hypothetical protein
MSNILPGSEVWIISEKFWEFGCINEDGTLDEKKVRKYFRIMQRGAAKVFRTLPYLLVDKSHADFEIRQSNFYPFKYNGTSFDLLLLNEQYFINLRRIAELANEYGMIFWFNIFDRCHGEADCGPWKNNVNGVRLWYDFNPFAQNYMKKVWETLGGLNVELELQNEPPKNMGFEEFWGKSQKYLLSLGVAREKLHCGAEFYHLSPLGMKNFVEGIDQPVYRRKNVSTIHKFEEVEYAYLLKHFQRYSDGPKKGQAIDVWEDGRRIYATDDGKKKKRTFIENLTFYTEVFKNLTVMK